MASSSVDNNRQESRSTVAIAKLGRKKDCRNQWDRGAVIVAQSFLPMMGKDVQIIIDLVKLRKSPLVIGHCQCNFLPRAQLLEPRRKGLKLPHNMSC
jgi:hypothetical protein